MLTVELVFLPRLLFYGLICQKIKMIETHANVGSRFPSGGIGRYPPKILEHDALPMTMHVEIQEQKMCYLFKVQQLVGHMIQFLFSSNSQTLAATDAIEWLQPWPLSFDQSKRLVN